MEKSRKFWDLVDEIMNIYSIKEYTAIRVAKDILGYLPKYSR